MPRRAKGPRLYLRRRSGRAPVWVILDSGKPELSTHCGEADGDEAQRRLAQYITEKYEPPKTAGKLAKTLIADVVNVYLREHAPKTADGGAWVSYMLAPILDHWGVKSLAAINAAACDLYVAKRLKSVGSDQTPRHELSCLRAAIHHYHANYGPLDAVPVVTLPAKAQARMDYWLTRKQVADRLRVARKNPRTRHIARLLLIGIYTGTRPGAILGLRWMPSTTGGWVDLESETLHRKAIGGRVSKKRAPAVRIHRRLLPWLKRWKAADEARGVTYVVHYQGRRAVDVRNSWRRIAGDREDGPHILRHTCVTWLLQSGVDIYEVSGFTGMSVAMIAATYGHHHSDHQQAAARADGRRAQVLPKTSVNSDRTNRQ